MTTNKDLDFKNIDNLIEDHIKLEASTEKYFKNVQDFQKKLSDALESIRVVKDLSFGLVNQERYKSKIQKILDDMIDLLRETEEERDGLNKKRFSPLEMEDNTPKGEGEEITPESSTEIPSNLTPPAKIQPLEKE